MPSYTAQFWAAIAVMLASGTLLAMQGVGYDKLGIGPLGVAWLGVLAPVLGIIAGLLPQVQRTPLTRSQAYTTAAITGLVPPDVELAKESMIEAEDEEPRVPPREHSHTPARDDFRPDIQVQVTPRVGPTGRPRSHANETPRPPTGVEIKARERAESPPVSEPMRRRRVRREDEG